MMNAGRPVLLCTLAALAACRAAPQPVQVPPQRLARAREVWDRFQRSREGTAYTEAFRAWVRQQPDIVELAVGNRSGWTNHAVGGFFACRMDDTRLMAEHLPFVVERIYYSRETSEATEPGLRFARHLEGDHLLILILRE
jgi:hypothetical protein